MMLGLDFILFCAVALAMVAGAVMVFLRRSVLNAVLYLTVVFGGSAMIFLLLGQTLIAILQLFIFVGGFSAYLIVTVAMERRPASYLNVRLFAALAILAVAGLYLLTSGILSGTGMVGTMMDASFQGALANYPLIFVIVLLLFSVLIGSIIVLKKFVRLVF